MRVSMCDAGSYFLTLIIISVTGLRKIRLLLFC